MKPPLDSWNRNGRRAYYLYGGALLVLVAAAGGWWWNLRTESSARYSTASVSRGSVTDVVTATGTVNPELNVIVGTYVSGVIKELYCDYNTRVTKGQVCAKIDPRPFETAVKQASASLAIAKTQLQKDSASLAYAKITYERNLRLVATHAVSQDAVDDAKSDYEQAQAQIASDEATVEHRLAVLDAARVKLGYTDIVSPVDGTVVSRNVTIGQTVAASFQTPILFLIASDLTRMQVDTNVSQGDIGHLKIGAQASLMSMRFRSALFRDRSASSGSHLRLSRVSSPSMSS